MTENLEIPAELLALQTALVEAGRTVESFAAQRRNGYPIDNRAFRIAIKRVKDLEDACKMVGKPNLGEQSDAKLTPYPVERRDEYALAPPSPARAFRRR